ncbi:hypothetical protein NONI108955_41175 [Nocardia ninae]|uniref:Uncharacterized protein n=1 Tax=Nocardia ninae NBRC 108245 TaxID=1210091 RepID=A0A511MJR5_9NOCA|nr:hypothetical protein [Nocardia ninae]GEM40882.1 hypothetical protein NN4_54010 [Nocardia ninae NBRC 108245]
MRSVAENLTIALGLINENGLGRGLLYNRETGCYCSLGAIHAARTGLRGFSVAVDEDRRLGTKLAYQNSPEAEAVRLSMLAMDLLPDADGDFADLYRVNDSVPNPQTVIEAFERAIENAA